MDPADWLPLHFGANMEKGVGQQALESAQGSYISHGGHED